MHWILLFLAMLLTALPVAALAVALVNRGEVTRLRCELRAAREAEAATRRRLEHVESRFAGLGRTAGPEPPATVEPPHPEPPRSNVEAEARPGGEPAVRSSTPPIRADTPSVRFERALGTRVAVWVGAVALILAGAFLVKYSFDRGWLGPAARVVTGLTFSAVLVGGAEVLRRRAAGVAQGLAASGVAVAFASWGGAVHLYGIVPPLAGFVALALTTAAAVGLALRHGQLIAVLGLAGGFLTPLWIGTAEPRPWMLVAYLLLLQAGLLTVSRRERWWPVAALTLLGAVGWAALWLLDAGRTADAGPALGLYLVASTLGFVALAGRRLGAPGTGVGVIAPTGLALGSAGASTVLLSALVQRSGFGPAEWAYWALLGAGCLVLARRDARYEPLAWMAALGGALLLVLWGDLPEVSSVRLAWTGAGLAVLYVGGAWLALWRSVRPDRWAALCGVSATAYLLAAYAALARLEPTIPWGGLALGGAAVVAVLAIPVARARATMTRGDGTLSALAVGVAALVGLAAPLGLRGAWITVAWSLEVPALAWCARRLRLPVLVHPAWLVAGAVAVRLLLEPMVLGSPIGQGRLLNWLAYGYGIPAAALVAAAMLFRGSGERTLTRTLEALAVAVGFAYLGLEVRHLFHAGSPGSRGFSLQQWGVLSVAWLAYAIVLLALHARTHRSVLRVGGSVVAGAALLQALVGQGLLANPWLHAQPVGATPVWNSLLLVYGLPAVLLAWLAASPFGAVGRIPARVFGAGSLTLALACVTLEVRQAFHGTWLDRGTTTGAEMYAYSAAWLLFATVLLVAGILRRGTVLRYGSAAVMLLAVAKVFLVDTAHLEDLYRVMSLLGLGLSLMLLAYLYQRFVFRETSV